MQEEILKPISDFVLFDIETTGLDSKIEKITEISALKIVNLQVVEVFTTLVNPGIPISPFISDITGITNDMVQDAPAPKEAVRSFLEFATGFVLAGHNIKRFDFGFIYKVAEEDLNILVENDYLDSLSLARALLPDLESRSLESLADYYNVSYQGAHRAEADCRINLEVIKNLFKEFDNPNFQARICPRCGKLLKKRISKFGQFWGCTGYPQCNHTEEIL